MGVSIEHATARFCLVNYVEMVHVETKGDS
jgi:hypothetical protein